MFLLASSLAAAPAGMAAGQQTPCFRIATPLAAGAIPRPSDVEAIDCEAPRPEAVFVYDQVSKMVRSRRSLDAGEVVASVPDFAVPAIQPRQALYVLVRAGAVAIERPVEALQPAQPGKQLFVRAGDGAVFAATSTEARP